VFEKSVLTWNRFTSNKSEKTQTRVRTNARSHRLDFTALDHLPYILGVTPSDYHIFRNLKEYLTGQHFWPGDEVETAVRMSDPQQDEPLYHDGPMKPPELWRSACTAKVITLRDKQVKLHDKFWKGDRFISTKYPVTLGGRNRMSFIFSTSSYISFLNHGFFRISAIKYQVNFMKKSIRKAATCYKPTTNSTRGLLEMITVGYLPRRFPPFMET
jgi:hypothetical protein